MYARTAFANAARPAARQALPRNARVPARSYATVQPPQQGTATSHLASGLLGGGVVLGGIYAYYKYTGVDKVVSTAQSVSQTAKSAKDKLADAAPGSTKEALALAKSVAKSYAAAIPGGAYAIDRGFKEIEDFVDANGEAAEKLIKDTYADIAKAAKSGDNSGEAVINALKEAGVKVQKLVGDEAAKGWEKLGEKFPELKKNLGEQGQELQQLAEKHGPEAQHIATDFYKKAAKLIADGGLNAKTYEQAKELLQEKKDELASFSQKAGRDAWDSAAKAAGPALDKMPDAKQALDQSLSKVEGYVGEDRVKAVKDLYEEISKIGSGQGTVEEKTKKAKDLIEEKVGKSSQFVALGLGSAAGKAGDLAQYGKKWLDEQVPGLSNFSKSLEGVDLSALKEVASKRGDEGKKLLDSTYEEIKQVLQKKGEEAKKLAEKAKEEGKDAAKK